MKVYSFLFLVVVKGVKDGSHNKAPGQQQTKEPVGLLPHPLTAANLGTEKDM